ncbi:MAG: FAD-dependent oxidoreductase [Pseudomonadota bacterium]
MSPTDPRYDILFEPVKIGPVTARNRFYQVPHCNGMGHRYPQAIAESRRIKAAGGWAVISTEECEIHPASDVSPYIEARLWDEGDMKRLALSVDAIHESGSLAAIEITHNGHHSGNRFSRLPTMAVSDTNDGSLDPVQAYAMSKRDIATFRKMHRQAAIRARDTGFDIVYVYAGHDLALPFHFLTRRHNRRSDEYGGSLKNRTRLLRELLEDTKDAVGDCCGIAIRLAVDELMGSEGIESNSEGREVVEMLAEMPDLWDVNVSDWSNDSLTSRFGEEGSQEKYTRFVKQLTSKPVVGVGRFTSADAMVSQIRRGVLDMIGAARPSISDPYLPEKIRQNRLEDIRECIGCNICVSSDMVVHPLRCTQNPTTAEEFRRGWHPEIISPKHREAGVLIVGAGPAGLEAGMSLGRRGYNVVLAEASDELGGRVLWESSLPGLSAWRRVIDYRVGQLHRLPNVSLHTQSLLDADQICEICDEMALEHVVLATGSHWRHDGIGRAHHTPIVHDGTVPVLTSDDFRDNERDLQGNHVVIYDDDHYYLASVLAEFCAYKGAKVTLATPASDVAAWTVNTLEQTHIEKKLRSLGIHLIEKHSIESIVDSCVRIAHNISGDEQHIAADLCVMVTSRAPENSLFWELCDEFETPHSPQLQSVDRVGDSLAPSTIAAAVYEGHRYAREFGQKPDPLAVPFRQERIEIN